MQTALMRRDSTLCKAVPKLLRATLQQCVVQASGSPHTAHLSSWGASCAQPSLQQPVSVSAVYKACLRGTPTASLVMSQSPVIHRGRNGVRCRSRSRYACHALRAYHMPPPHPRHSSRCLGALLARPRRVNETQPKQTILTRMQVVTPPTRSLGVHALPANTHNGDIVHIEEARFFRWQIYLRISSQQRQCRLSDGALLAI